MLRAAKKEWFLKSLDTSHNYCPNVIIKYLLDKNPDRYLDDNAEDQIQKFSFLAFGEGRHSCLGERFACLQVKTIWSILSRKFDFELCHQHPEPDYSALVVGSKAPCMMKFRRKMDPYTFNHGKLD